MSDDTQKTEKFSNYAALRKLAEAHGIDYGVIKRRLYLRRYDMSELAKDIDYREAYGAFPNIREKHQDVYGMLLSATDIANFLDMPRHLIFERTSIKNCTLRETFDFYSEKQKVNKMSDERICVYCGYTYAATENRQVCVYCMHEIDTGERLTDAAIAFNLNRRDDDVKKKRAEFGGDDIKLAKFYFGNKYSLKANKKRHEAKELAQKYGITYSIVSMRLKRGETIEEIEAFYKAKKGEK